MVRSEATTPEAYIDEIEDDERRDLVVRLRELIGANLQPGYVESMRWGMITWEIPMEVSGPTYNDQPLGAVALANQKNYVSVYLMGVYGDPEVASSFESDWKATGRKLDMGKSCVRVRHWEDVAVEPLVEAVASTSVDDMLGMHDAR